MNKITRIKKHEETGRARTKRSDASPERRGKRDYENTGDETPKATSEEDIRGNHSFAL